MKPETEHHVPVLDGWRGLAIIGVLIDHYWTSAVIDLGRFGVEFFFVLSGRLMADILFVRQTPLRVFFPRRFARIYPALFCFATIVFLFAQTTGRFDIPPTVYASSLFFTINYVAIFWFVSAATDHLWSLAIEEHCYILLGVLAALGRWKTNFPVWWIIVGLIAVAVANGAYQTFGEGLHYHNVYWRTDVRGASILISVAFYLWLRARPTPPGWLGHAWTPVLCTAAAVLASLNVVPDPVKYSLGTFLLAIGVTTLPQAPRLVQTILTSRLLTTIGIGSFSLYLWQQPFAMIRDPAIRYSSLALVGTIAWLSYNAVEQPARRALNRLLAPRVHPVAATVVAPQP